MIRSSRIELVISAIIAPLFARYALRARTRHRIVMVAATLLIVGVFALAWHHVVSPGANGCGIVI